MMKARSPHNLHKVCHRVKASDSAGFKENVAKLLKILYKVYRSGRKDINSF
ncbi:MAG: hypothetical protein E6344_04580 [Clostridium sp.]|nr:hypothetical protein [Clostridium sp.]